MTPERSAPSVAWTLTGALTPQAREVLAETLGCVFTDENAPRSEMDVCSGVTMAAVPQDGAVRLVAHFTELVKDHATTVSWLTTWVERAAAGAGLAPPAAVEVVHTGA